MVDAHPNPAPCGGLSWAIALMRRSNDLNSTRILVGNNMNQNGLSFAVEVINLKSNLVLHPCMLNLRCLIFKTASHWSFMIHGFNYSISEAPGQVELRYAQQATERCAAVLGLQAMKIGTPRWMGDDG